MFLQTCSNLESKHIGKPFTEKLKPIVKSGLLGSKSLIILLLLKKYEI